MKTGKNRVVPDDVKRASRRGDSPQSGPTSGASPPLNDGDETAAEERVSPFEVDGPDGGAPSAPPLPFTASTPVRAAYQAAFEAAWRYPNDLMQIMIGIRKGLRRGKKAARRAGGQGS